MRTVFVVNPHAGAVNGLEEIRDKIAHSRMKESCDIYVTKGVGDATAFVRSTCVEHPEEPVRFIACGGDGTLNEVVNGAVGFPHAEVGCYPCGSGNDFVKSFGGAERFLDIDALVRAEAVEIDLMKVGDLYSDNVVNFGFDTVVAKTVNEGRAKRGNAGKGYYTLGILRALLTAMRNRFKVYADGDLLNPSGIALLCTLANGEYVGGSFRCAPRADLQDGLMEVCLVKTVSRLRFVSLIGLYTKGEHLDNEKMKDIVVYRRAKQVRVRAPKGFAFSLDGEIVEKNDFTVEMVPRAIRFVLPGKTDETDAAI